MKKKIKSQSPPNTCKDCACSIPDYTSLSLDTKEPILCDCKYENFKKLLSSVACKNFEKIYYLCTDSFI